MQNVLPHLPSLILQLALSISINNFEKVVTIIGIVINLPTMWLLTEAYIGRR